jgi:hypothetical protein
LKMVANTLLSFGTGRGSLTTSIYIKIQKGFIVLKTIRNLSLSYSLSILLPLAHLSFVRHSLKGIYFWTDFLELTYVHIHWA